MGYLKISYIPQERFEENFQNIFDFMYQEGHTWAKGILKEPQEERIKTLSFHVGGWPGIQLEEIVELSQEEKDKIEKKYVKLAHRKFKKRFDDFKEFHVDKPLVDYIRVETDKQRQRVGAGLYEFGFHIKRITFFSIK